MYGFFVQMDNDVVGSIIMAVSIYYGHEFPDSKVHGAKMGPIWGQQDPGGPHVVPMNVAIWVKTPCSSA